MIEDIIHIVKEAAVEVLKIYNTDFDVEYKDDKSPLTKADLVANRIIIDGLKNISSYPILSEEEKTIPYSVRKDWEYFWMIDPIDGTKEFVNRNGEFTINIALIHKNRSILGVVYAPVIDKLYYAQKDKGAYLLDQSVKIKLPSTTTNNFTVVASKSHLSQETKEFIDSLKQNYPNLQLVSKGSSLKLCMVAQGLANIYPRLAPTMEWDTAAAHIIVEESGKKVYQYDRFIKPLQYIKDNNLKEILYNKEDLRNNYFIVI